MPAWLEAVLAGSGVTAVGVSLRLLFFAAKTYGGIEQILKDHESRLDRLEESQDQHWQNGKSTDRRTSRPPRPFFP